jgi:serine O-acetyltransferase
MQPAIIRVTFQSRSTRIDDMASAGKQTTVWTALWQEAVRVCEQEAALAPLIESTVTASRNIAEATAKLLVKRLATSEVNEDALTPIFEIFLSVSGPSLNDIITRDMECILKHDPAATNPLTPFLFFKGFHALQAYRLSHHLWNTRHHQLAFFIQSRISARFHVDIHPAAKIGHGIMMDHATGIVIGETAVVENNVLFWHGVTLGGTGFETGDRHPKVREGAVLGANSTILGNIEIGRGAKVAAGSMVLSDVAENTTVAGVPAKPV